MDKDFTGEGLSVWNQYLIDSGYGASEDILPVGFTIEVLTEKVPEGYRLKSIEKTPTGWRFITERGVKGGEELADVLMREVIEVINEKAK